MIRRSRKLAAAAITGAVAASLLFAAPAMAEGSRSSSIPAPGWTVGTRSSTWADSNGDSAATRVRLTSIQLYVPNTPISWTNISSTQLQLLKDVWGTGWVSQGNRTAAPGANQDWGDVAAGTYRFQYNGGTPAGQSFKGSGSGVWIIAGGANISW
ncbi:MAG: hypothetical protein K0Q52_395 [Microbacterium sp.]|jgi:hypothetical protein|uniref:hypothetical protein n=1 Tax=Microbacterium sp. ISL-59 TaxID=2819159 RepID=UPI001BEBD01A|nr:hypothetical protein [Microbacterium sp. ISL-59]MBT2496707.1 hypothetical protein [Microbacterium sp. ISL-59]MDF2506536.1 hypothetical protein [Microbacterium sp.]